MPYLVGERYSSWFDLILCIPKRLAYLVLYPFPWILSSYKAIVPAFSSLHNIIFITSFALCLMIGWKKTRLKDEKYIIVMKLFAVMTVCLIIYAVAKTEVAHRHRMQFTWLMPVLASSLLVKDEGEYNENKSN